MAWPTNNRTNLLAGLFLIVGIALFVATTAVLGGLSLNRTTTYTARFPLSASVAGLQTGSTVTVGGVDAGKVTDVAFAAAAGSSAGSAQPATPVAVDVSFAVRSDISVRDDAKIELVRPLLGTLATLNIRSLGTGASAEGAVLDGVIGMPGFLADAGYGPEAQTRIAGIIGHFESISRELDTLIAGLGDRSDPVLNDVAAASKSLRSLLERASERFPVWDERIMDVLDNAGSLVDDLRETAELAESTIRNAGDAIEEIRGRIDVIADNTERATAGAADAIDEIRADMLPNASSALDDAAAAAARARTILERERVAIRRVMSNLTIVSEQAKLAAGEIRGEPWRLLRSPDTKELGEQLVYDAARAFAQAAGDMREASESLTAVIDPEEPSPARDAEVEAIRAELAELQAQLAEAGQRLLERLDDERGR